MSKETNAKDFPSLMQRNGLLKMSSAGGCLIAFEGIDGAGKTTQARLLYDYLKDQGHNVLLTREPTDGPYGQKIRELFVSRQKVTPQEELDLFINDRRQHVEEVIKPALHEGWIVITDRYYFSAMAYQGAMGLSVPDIRRRNEEFAPVPDMVILLIARPDETVERIRNNRREKPNNFEKEDYLRRVQDIFLSLNDSFIYRIDGHDVIDAVQAGIQKAINQLITARTARGGYSARSA